uniref:Myosin-11 n=1 Tax=Rhizophora mucronata TaxID=61149 RepID=A0A2P2K271_RHIMU
MSISEQPLSNSLAAPVEEFDPLLKDLNEKKQSFRRNVVSLAAELKEVRSRLASKEQLFAKETITRQEAENTAKKMGEQIYRLQKTLEERNCQLQSSASNSEKVPFGIPVFYFIFYIYIFVSFGGFMI